MKLIWTFNTNIPSMYEAPWQKDILLSFYIASIKSAKKIGYNTVIYTNESLVKTFELIADDIIIVEEYEQSELFDCFKIKVLEERTDDFYLVDGDILFNSPLPIFDVDVTFDAVETNFIEESYITPIKNSIELGIISEIPFLEHERLKTVFNCGVLRINDPNLKNEYIKYIENYNTLLLIGEEEIINFNEIKDILIFLDIKFSL